MNRTKNHKEFDEVVREMERKGIIRTRGREVGLPQEEISFVPEIWAKYLSTAFEELMKLDKFRKLDLKTKSTYIVFEALMDIAGTERENEIIPMFQVVESMGAVDMAMSCIRNRVDVGTR